jgi:hypothetical protein
MGEVVTIGLDIAKSVRVCVAFDPLGDERHIWPWL